jgi:hypothetical protein
MYESQVFSVLAFLLIWKRCRTTFSHLWIFIHPLQCWLEKTQVFDCLSSFRIDNYRLWLRNILTLLMPFFWFLINMRKNIFEFRYRLLWISFVSYESTNDFDSCLRWIRCHYWKSETLSTIHLTNCSLQWLHRTNSYNNYQRMVDSKTTM